MKLIEKNILDFKMYLDQDDEGINQELIETGTHEKASIDFIKTILRPDMNVIELGANIGFYVFIEASIVNHVYAIEPVKYNFEILTKNIELNRFKNILTYRLAVGGNNGKIKIHTSNRCNWATIVPENERAKEYAQLWNNFEKGEEEVPLYTLDKFTEEFNIGKIDLIRMDVEGAEVDIIPKGLLTLQNMPKNSYLFVEVHGSCITNKEKVGKMIDIIEASGFKVIKAVTRKSIALNIKNMADLRDKLMTMGACPQVFFNKE